jgi:hypothetical protein
LRRENPPLGMVLLSLLAPLMDKVRARAVVVDGTDIMAADKDRDRVADRARGKGADK